MSDGVATETRMLALSTGITVRVTLDGEGPDLLMLGGPHTSELMRGFVGPNFTRAGFRLVTVEYRGVPPSDTPPGLYTVAQLTADTIALLEGADLAPLGVFGYSLGAFVVQELLVERPDLVRAAVLAATRLEHCLASSEMHEMFIQCHLDGTPLPPATELLVRAQMMFGPRRLASDAFVSTMAQVLALPPTEGYNAVGLTTASLDYRARPERLAAIRTPTRVIGMEHDLLTPRHQTAEVAGLIPGAEYRQIRRSGHGGFIEQPRELTRLVTEFLDPAPPGDGSDTSRRRRARRPEESP